MTGFSIPDYRAAYADKDVIIIGVGTPEKKDGSANLSYVYAVAGQIAESVTQDCVVVVKSTVPIGTNDKVEAILNAKSKSSIRIRVASNPGFSWPRELRCTTHCTLRGLSLVWKSAKPANS
ncbi:MAG: hypothetical protein V8Q17_09995 [Acutalibacteraceae bacterium]